MLLLGNSSLVVTTFTIKSYVYIVAVSDSWNIIQISIALCVKSVLYQFSYVLVCYLELLVQFLTFKSEPFEQNAINKMDIELPSSDTTKPASHHDAITHGRYHIAQNSSRRKLLWFWQSKHHSPIFYPVKFQIRNVRYCKFTNIFLTKTLEITNLPKFTLPEFCASIW